MTILLDFTRYPDSRSGVFLISWLCALQRDQRVLRAALDHFDDVSEIVLVHVNVLPLGHLTLADSQNRKVRSPLDT